MRDKVTKEEMDKALTVQMEKITEKEKDTPESFANIKEQLEMQMEQYNESLEHVKTIPVRHCQGPPFPGSA